MRDDPQLIANITPGSIVQINPDDEHGLGGKFIVVRKVESWGVAGYIPGGMDVTRTWQHVEDTGGRSAWDKDGKRAYIAPAPLRHHP